MGDASEPGTIMNLGPVGPGNPLASDYVPLIPGNLQSEPADQGSTAGGG